MYIKDFLGHSTVSSTEIYATPDSKKQREEILKNSNINVLDSFEDDKIISNLVKNEKSLDKNLVMIFKEKGQEEGLNEIIKFKNGTAEKIEINEKPMPIEEIEWWCQDLGQFHLDIFVNFWKHLYLK